MKKILLLLLVTILPLFARAASEEVAATAIAHDAFRLTPTQTSANRSMMIDSTLAFSVAVTAASQNLQIRLVAPNGAQYTVGEPNSGGFESATFPIAAGPAPGAKPGASYLATVNNPQTGNWSLQVTPLSSLDSGLDVVVLTMLNNATRAVLAGAGDTYPLGTPVRLALVVFDGTAKVRNLRVDAKLFQPDVAAAASALDFRDDGTGADDIAGDGIYQAFASPALAGRYQVQVNASGSASGGAFRRTTAGQIVVVAKQAAIDPMFSDRSIDLNGDALLDQIGVAPHATILEGGSYNLGVRLRGSNGKELFKTIEHDFTPGPVTPEVLFESADIVREIGVDGPYQVAEVRFLRQVGNDLVPADIRYDLGQTAAYALTDFQRSRLALTGNGSAIGVDFDADRRFDRLDVTVEVRADFAGGYNYSVRLADVNGKELGFRSGALYLNAGPNQITFSFDGFPIGLNAVDGPYFLSDLLLFGAGQALVADQAFTTPALRASQFEGYPLDVTPPTLNISVTPSVLWPANHRMVEITPGIVVSDDRDANPTVELVSIISSEADNAGADGDTAKDIQIDANGKIFLRAERSGTGTGRVYTLTWLARDSAGNTSMASATVAVPHDRGR